MHTRKFVTTCLVMGKRSTKTDKNCKSKTGKEIVKEAQASPFQSATDGSTLVTVHLKPGAKFDEIINVGEDNVSISVKSAPVEGQANSALLALLAEITGAKKSQVSLKSGHKSRDKVVSISGVSLLEIESRLKSNASK